MPTPIYKEFIERIDKLNKLVESAGNAHESIEGVEALLDIKSIIEYAEDAYKEASAVLYSKSIEQFGQFVTIKSTEYGTIFAKVTPSYDVPKDSPFRKESVSSRADTKGIEEYRTKHGVLPQDVKLIKESVSIQVRSKTSKEE